MSYETETEDCAVPSRAEPTNPQCGANPRLSRQRYRTRTRSEIPIINLAGVIVAWTPTAPSMQPGCGLRHAEAESLLGGRVTCRLVKVTGMAAVRAGAPFAESGWSCFALVAENRTAPESGSP